MDDNSTRTLEALDWPYLARALSSHARTAAGRRAAENVALESDPAVIAAAFDTIDEIRALRETGVGSPPVGGVEDIGQPLEAARQGRVLELEDLAVVRSTIGSLARLGAYLARHHDSAPVLGSLGAPIALDDQLCASFEAAIDEQHGGLSERTYPMLAELRARMAALERRMRTTVEALLDAPEYADVLQDRYVTSRDGRFVVPIKAAAKSMGLGIVHDASRTRQTLFLEPAAVVPLGNEWRMAEFDLRSEERRILVELSSLLAHHAESLAQALFAAAAIDLACCRADFAARLNAVRPSVGDEGVVDLHQARHAVLALANSEIVANDLSLSTAAPVLVLTGPNAGGKTIAMKTIGLCALLVRAGCFIPAASGSRIDLFGEVLADIGDSQTVHEGLSSFSAHLTALRSMLETAGPGTLVLLDEIAAGTDPAQGGALARAFVERFADAGARVVVTTHYAQLKVMPATDDRVAVAALEYRQDCPTYRVVAGMTGESHGLAAALRAGIDEALVERARSLMGDAERALHEALSTLEIEREQTAAATLLSEQKTAELASREVKLVAREIKIKRRAREMEEAGAAEFLTGLRDAEQQVRDVLAALRENPNQAAAASARALVVQSKAAAVLPEAPRPSGPRRAPVIGDRVRVQGLGAMGDVVAIDGDEFEVRAGVMMMRVGADKLEVVGKAAAPNGAENRPRRTGKGPNARSGSEAGVKADFAFRTSRNTLDLRGVRVDEGLAKLNDFLDEAMLAGHDAIFVLHGHGTGAMKSAVRKLVADSQYVSSAAPAAEEQGGDAFTVVQLRG
ncbi:MAG: DNA mismatch repair protein MutS2 [Hyphomicrobiaceae bacterium]|jgi:DNA mismatch repair protein MutS2